MADGPKIFCLYDGKMRNTMEKKMTFEQGMARLEEIVALLENGEAPLDESLKLFTEGVKLTDFCSEKLKKAEQVVKNVMERKPEKSMEQKQDA